MSWVTRGATVLVAYATIATSTPVFASEAIASINPKQSGIESIVNNVTRKAITSKEVTSTLEGHDDEVESMLKAISRLLEGNNIMYHIEGDEVRKSFYHDLDEGTPCKIKVGDGEFRYKTMAPVDKVIHASAVIINKDIHVSLRLTERVDIYKWLIKAISIPPDLDFVIKPVKSDYGYDARLFYSSEKPFVSKIATFFKGIHADRIEARIGGTPNNLYMLKMITNLNNKDLINVYDENYRILLKK